VTGTVSNQPRAHVNGTGKSASSARHAIGEVPA
jgi:hypothetical protein